MDKKYVDNMQRKYEEEIAKKRQQTEELFNYLNDNINNDEIKYMISKAKERYSLGLRDASCFLPFKGMLSIYNITSEEYEFAIKKLKRLLNSNPYGEAMPIPKDLYNNLLDSEPVTFRGDIIITDPCYLTKKRELDDTEVPPTMNDYVSYAKAADYPDFKSDDGITGTSETYNKEFKAYADALAKWEKEHMDDWEKCSYGKDMSAIGIENCICRDTIYGDWSCSVYNTDSNTKIGDFCADAGMVCVCELEEILKYNPSVKEFIDGYDWCVTTIKDFEGTVYFKVVEKNGDYFVKVVGNGKNIKTDEPINFVSDMMEEIEECEE